MKYAPLGPLKDNIKFFDFYLKTVEKVLNNHKPYDHEVRIANLILITFLEALHNQWCYISM